jgi:hypothetical protein
MSYTNIRIFFIRGTDTIAPSKGARQPVVYF